MSHYTQEVAWTNAASPAPWHWSFDNNIEEWQRFLEEDCFGPRARFVVVSVRKMARGNIRVKIICSKAVVRALVDNCPGLKFELNGYAVDTNNYKHALVF